MNTLFEGFEWLMVIFSLMGYCGLISWVCSILVGGYSKKEIIRGIIYCVTIIVVGSFLSNFKFFRFISQITLIIV